MKFKNPIKLFLSNIILSSVLMATACNEQIPTGNPTEALTSGEVRFNITDDINTNPKILNSILAHNLTYNKIIMPTQILTSFDTAISSSRFVSRNGLKSFDGTSGSIFYADILESMRTKNMNDFLVIQDDSVQGDNIKVFYGSGITSASNRYIVLTDSYGDSTQTVQALNSVGQLIGQEIIAGTIQDQNRTTEYVSTGITVNLNGKIEPLYAAVYPLTALVPRGQKIYGLKISQKDTGDGTDGKVFIILDEEFLKCTIFANNDDFTDNPLEIGELTPSIFLDNGNGTDKSNLNLDAIDANINDNISIINFNGLSPNTRISTNGEIEIPEYTQSGLYMPTYQICLEKDITYCDTATIKLKVNNKPITVNDSDNTDQGLSILVDVLTNDYHFDTNETLSIFSVKNSPNGLVEINGTKVLYTPNPGFYGEDTFTYVIDDLKGNKSEEGEATIIVRQAPDILLEDAQTIEGGFLRFNISLTHGYRADMRITFEIEDLTTNTDDYNKSKIYVDILSGELSTSYNLPVISDLVDENNEELKLKIKKVSTEIGTISSEALGRIIDNDTSPTAVDDLRLATYTNNMIIDVLSNDLAGTSIIKKSGIKLLDGNSSRTTLIISGEGKWTIDDINGTVIFTPEKGYVGDPTEIKYLISDIGNNTDTANIRLNYPPLAIDDQAISKVNDSIIINVLENDKSTSTPLDITSIRLVNFKNELVDSLYIDGKGTFNVNKTRGTIEFVPDNDFSGDVSVKYKMRETNGDISNEANILISYPNLTDDVITDILAGIEISLDVIANDGENINPSSVKLIGASDSGLLIVSGEGQWRLNGSILTFTPEKEFLDNPTPIQYTAAYKNVYLNPANVSILYNKGNIYAKDDLGIIVESKDTNINFLLNDSYGAYGPGEIDVITTKPKHGRIIVNNNGTIGDFLDDSITYKVNAVDYIGVDTFSYTITDIRGDKATAKITLNITKSTSQKEDSGNLNKILFLLLLPILIVIRRKKAVFYKK